MDCRRTSDEKPRWLTAILLEMERRLCWIGRYGGFPLLRQALLAEIPAGGGAGMSRLRSPIAERLFLKAQPHEL
jgi:hypothetical protein